MSAENRTNEPKIPATALVKKFSVPVQLTDLLAQDGPLASVKERFAAEMRRMDEEMIKFSAALQHIYGQTTTVQAGMTSTNRENPVTSWDAIAKSPLVEGDGENKILNLQFDVRDYDPHEITVKILSNTLFVAATHQEKSGSNTEYREFHREFLLPSGTKPEAVESSLSKDGVLTVRAPLHLELLGKENPTVTSNSSFEEN